MNHHFYLYPCDIESTRNGSTRHGLLISSVIDRMVVSCSIGGLSHESHGKVARIKLAVYLDEPLLHHLTSNLSKNIMEIHSIIEAYISQTNSILATLKSRNFEKIYLKLVKVELDPLEMPDDNLMDGNLDVLLSKFCLYQMNERKSEHEWHLGLLLTQRRLYSSAEEVAINSLNDQAAPETMGMSPVGGIRWADLSCLVVKFSTNGSLEGELSNLQSPSVVAHEVAHNLGIHHDHEGCEDDAIMSATCQLKGGSKKWSNCSISALDEIGKLDFLCVTNFMEPITQLKDLPGQQVDARTQCKLHHPSLEYLNDNQANEDSICLDSLICQLLEGEVGKSLVPVGPAWEGTACGSDKVCIGGSCRAVTDLSTFLLD